ncbi:hypothetical protein GCM10027605_65930 [Micromonospora zhanjiangensis]
MSVYLTAPVRAQLAAAQRLLDRHTPSSADGCCAACGVDGPCPQRRAALRVFGRYGCLPRRWLGATRPDLVQPPAGWSGWLAGAVGDAMPTGLTWGCLVKLAGSKLLY